MKFLNRIKLTLISIKESIKRFPITVMISTVLAIFLIYMNESSLIGQSRETIQKLNLVIGLGIPLSLCIGLLVEKFFNGDNIKIIFAYALGAVFLFIYYNFFLDDIGIIAGSRYIATMIALIIISFYIPRFGEKGSYEYYVMDVFSGFSLTFIYSFVLYFGLAAIFLTIDQLFDVNIKSELYYYMFLIVTFIFAVSLFLSKLPNVNEKYENIEYTKALNILLIYIVIPLISIYTAILYVYFAKILVTREWPRGLVSHLVLWYSTISVGVIFLITPILEENRIAKLFKRWFPKIVLPVIFMMFLSIYQRVDQYGITENRYYIIVLGLWVLGIMLYFSIKKPLKNIIIPISLSIVILNSVFGPLSSFSISKYSQNIRFKELLNKNNMISNGEIIKNTSISLEDKNEINSILLYFKNKHEIQDIKVLPEDFDLENMENTIGFKYEPYISFPYEQNKYFYYGTNNNENVLDISGYNYFLNISSWNNNNIVVDDLTLKYNGENNIFTVSKDGQNILEQDLKEFVKAIYEKQEESNINYEKGLLSYEDTSYELYSKNGVDDFKFKFIFTEINGRIDIDNEFNIESVNFIFLIKSE